MLDKFILKDALIVATKNKEYPGIWNDISQVIKDHIEQNGLVTASYVGTIPSVPPVPSAFNVISHYFHIATNIWGPNLAIAGQGGFQAFLAGLSFELSKTMVAYCTTTNFSILPVGPLIPVAVNFITEPDDTHEDVMLKMADAIVNAFLMALPVPPSIATPVPATAIDGSVGLLTFVSIK